MKFQLRPMPPVQDVAVHLALWLALLVALQVLIAAFPSPELDHAVSAKYPRQLQIVVSANSAYSGGTKFSRRSYILLPRFVAHPAFVKARSVNLGTPSVSENPALAAISGIVFLVGCVFYFGRRWRAFRNGA